MAGEIYTLTELTAAGEASTSKVWLGAEYDALSNASYAPRKIEKVELTKMLPFISRTLPTVMHGTTFTTYATSVLAADALTAGDTLFLPAVTLSVATAMNIDVNNVTIVCPFGRCTLHRATNTTNIDWLMYVTGTGFRIQDVIFDGVASGTNTGRGEGMRINAAGARVVDCDFINAYTTGTATNNYALNVLTSGNRITGCNFSDGSYAAIRCYGSHNRFSDCRILRFDMALRYDGAGDSLFIEDFYVEDAAGLECQFLIDGGSTVTGLKFLSMRNVNMNLANYDPTASTAAIRVSVARHPRRVTTLVHTLAKGAIVLYMISWRPEFDFLVVLFLALTYPVSIFFGGRVRWIWILALVLLSGGSLIFYLGVVRGLALSLTTMASEIVIPAFLIVNHEIETARMKSQTLLKELQETHQQLELYANQVEDLAAMQERNRLARELHDSVKQQVFAISMQLSAARNSLTESDKAFPSVTEAERLAQQAGLAQLRSVITRKGRRSPQWKA